MSPTFSSIFSPPPPPPPSYSVAPEYIDPPPPYQDSGSPGYIVDSRGSPPSYAESAIRATSYSPSMLATDPQRAAALRKTFSEMFEGIVSRFSEFDRAAQCRFVERPMDARRLMAAIGQFDSAVADLFRDLPAIEKRAKPGKVGHPVIAKMMEAIRPLDNELKGWVLPTTTTPHPDSDLYTSAINQCVQNMRDDLLVAHSALQTFHHSGTLHNTHFGDEYIGHRRGGRGSHRRAQSADAIADARARDRIHASCVIA